MGLGVGIGADLVWAFTCAYAYWYQRMLGNYTEHTPEPRAMVHPTVSGSGAPGIGLSLRF